MFELTLPDGLLETILMVHGEDARQWYDSLPDLVTSCQAKWGLSFEHVLTGGVLSCCIAARDRAGTSLVVKLPSSADLLEAEVAALAAWGGVGAPRLMGVDTMIGAFVMTRVLPGTTVDLAHTSNDSVNVARLINRLGQAARPGGVLAGAELAGNLATRIDWATRRFEEPQWSLERSWLEIARTETEELLDSVSGRRLVHGDLQTKNILLSQRGEWVAIDPLPCLGEVEFDAAFWAVMQDSPVAIEERVEQLVHRLDVDAERVDRWARVLSIVEQRPWDEALYPRLRELAERVYAS